LEIKNVSSGREIVDGQGIKNADVGGLPHENL
jgi:hypothetical protein